MVTLRLSEVLQEKNMSTQDLIKKGMNKGTVAHLVAAEQLKNPNSHISFKVINQLCKILNCTPGELFKYEKDDS